jgi:hypothetical protein
MILDSGEMYCEYGNAPSSSIRTKFRDQLSNYKLSTEGCARGFTLLPTLLEYRQRVRMTDLISMSFNVAKSVKVYVQMIWT